MDPEQLFAQLVASSIAASATTAKSATRSRPSLVRFATVPCADSGSGSVSRSKSSTSQSNLDGYERFGKASTVEELRILGTTHRELRCEHTPWSERRLNVGRGKRIGNSDRSEAATEVVKLLDTLRMLADQLYTVLMTLVEGESFDILVRSGSGEGLEAWRRLHKRWDPLTIGRARGLLREILSPGRAKLVELQGAVERLEDLMRRYTQRRDARNGQRHTLAEEIRMAALEVFFLRNSSDTVNSNGHGWIRTRS